MYELEFMVALGKAFKKRYFLQSLLALLLFNQLVVNTAFGKGNTRIIHVAKTGSDANVGKVNSPLFTIDKASKLARPGDRIIVHKGTYREMIILQSGGTSESARISFTTAPGEEVLIKGSEQITTWRKESSNIWKAVILHSFFKGLNPFAEKVNKDSSYIHLGEVYINDKPLKENKDVSTIKNIVGSWFASSENGQTIITANFGQKNPNVELTEINVRPGAFIAIKPGINHIVLDGFKISQIASQMVSINGEQPGAISVNGGKQWLIQNCKINDCKSVAISIGQTGHTYPNAGPGRPEYSDLSQDISGIGHHIIRHNHIFRCGQAGIFGLLHGSFSEITNNLIEDINSNDEFPSKEVAGIRLALAVDALISHNLIRRVKGASNGYGLFIGPLFQGTRISANVISDTRQSCVYFYNSHGPALIDNNIFSGPGKLTSEGVKMVSAEANVFVQNLFYDCGFTNTKIVGRSIATSNFLPHLLVIKQTIPALPIDDRWYSNLFIKGGLDQLDSSRNCEANYNVYADNASVCSWGDKRSKVISGSAHFRLVNSIRGVSLFLRNHAIPEVACPTLSPSFIGFFALSKQFIESPDGSAITINSDFKKASSNKLSKLPGPLYQYSKVSSKGENLFTY